MYFNGGENEIILEDISEGELKIFMRVVEQMKENIANSF